MGRGVLVQGEGSGQLVGDGVWSSEKVFLDASVHAMEDVVAGGDDATGIWREWKLWRRTRKPSPLS